MATIQRYEEQVRDRPVGQVYHRADGVSGEAFGAGVGRAIQGVGKGLADVGEALRISKELTEEAQGIDRYQASRREILQSLYDPSDGFLTRRGGTAVGTTETAADRFEDVRERGRDGLTPRAQRAYDQRLADLADQSYVKVAEHETQQRTAYTEEMFRSVIENALDDAGLNWADDEWFDKTLQDGIAEVQRFGIFSGRDQKATEIAVQNFVSSASRNRILAAATADPSQIERMIEQHKSVLTAKDLHELQTNMKGLIAETKAQAFVGGFLRRGFDPVANDPYERAVIRRESGGNPDARNPMPGQTAGGLYGYTDGTYVMRVRQMQPDWAAGMSSAEIVATKFDPAHAREVFEFDRKQNQQALTRKRLEVNPTNEYMVHHFGVGEGPKLIAAAQRDPTQTIASVLGAARAEVVLRANPHLRQYATVGALVRGISQNLGVDGPTLAGGTHFDAAAAYEAAMNIEDPAVQAAALKRIELMEAAQAKARGAEVETTMRSAWDDYQRTGNMDPGVDARVILGPTGWSSLQAAISNDIQGIDKTDPLAWETLTRMAYEDPELFRNTNLEDLRSRLSKADMERFVTAQMEARAEFDRTPGTDEKVRDLPLTELVKPAHDVYDQFTAAMGDSQGADKRAKEEMARRRYEFDRRLQQMIQEHSRQNDGRKPSQSEVVEMARALLTEVEFTNTTGGSNWFSRQIFGSTTRKGYLFEAAMRQDGEGMQIATSIEDVPIGDRQQIEQLWDEKFGEAPTPEQVASTYANMNLVAQGLTPVVSIRDVPQQVVNTLQQRRAEAGKTPLSDADIVDAYTVFLLDQRLAEETTQ